MKNNQLKKNIPNEWHEIKLVNVFEFKNGLNKEKKFFGRGTPIVNYMDINRGGGLYADNISGKVDVNKSELDRFNVKKGDVFFTRTSETLKEIGMSAVALGDFHNTVFSGFVLRARPKSKILLPDFAKYCFTTPKARQEIIEKSSYTTRALTSGTLLNHVRLLLPSVNEQNRIVSVLETWDQVIEKLTKKIEIKKNIKKGLMQDLLTGKKRLSGFNDEWVIIKLGDACDIQKGQQLNMLNMISDGLYPALNGGVEPSGFTDKWNMDENTITISEGGNSCGYVNFNNSKFWCGGHCYAIKNRDDIINKKFLYQLLKENQNNIMNLRVGSGLPNIQKSSLEKFKIAIPSKNEQIVIASILENADKEIKYLENKLANIEDQKKYLLNNLITGAIRTPEDLNKYSERD